jgi:hypothetical protein
LCHSGCLTFAPSGPPGDRRTAALAKS